MELDEITRILQITGGSTYVISLPKKWIRELNIEQGTQIKIQRVHLVKPNTKINIFPWNVFANSASIVKEMHRTSYFKTQVK